MLAALLSGARAAATARARSREGGAHRARLAVAVDAPRPAQHRRQPAPRPLPRRRPAVALPHRQGRVQHTRIVRRRDRLRRARPTPGSTPSVAAAGSRWRYKTGEIIDSAGVLARGHRHLRLGRRAHLPAANGRRAALSRRAAHGLALPGHAQAGRGPARELVGGQRDDGLRRATSSPATPAAPSTRSPRAGSSAGSTRPATRCGRTRRSPTTARVYFGSLDLTVRAVTPRGKLKWQKGAGNFVTSSPRSAATGRCTSARSTARSTRSTRAPARCAGASRPTTTCTPRRRSGRGSCTSRPPTARCTRSTAPAGCAGATTRATRALLAGARARAARRRPDPLRGLVRRQPLRARRRDGPPPLVVRHDPARPGAARPQRPERLARRSAAAACTSAASTA